MMVRLFLSVALVANILVLVTCTGKPSDVSSAKTNSNSKAISRKCIRVKKCPQNEEYSYCPQSLQRAQYCSEKGEPLSYITSDRKPCEEGCVCKEKYLRAENGTCIPEDQCTITCGPNEVLDNCPADCESDYCPTSDEDSKSCTSPKICPAPACKCIFNHRRALNGSCIPTTDCPPFSCKRVNEEYNPCPPICPTDDCSQATPTGKCPLIGRIGIVLPCNPKCRCIKGYWKLNGTCVPYGECPGVCPANERYSGCIQGECRPLNCSDKGKSLPCPRIDPDFCETGCVCEEGYLRTGNGTCVLEDQCDANTCLADEEYVPCIQGVCRAMDCSQKGKDVPCPDIPKEKCDSGCICKENFLRTDTGSCVPEDQCETHECPANEEWSTCAQATCRAQNCTQKGKPIACPLIAEGYCIEACVCKTGYLRDDSGACVPEDQCPSKLICGENEYLVNCSSTCTSDHCPRSADEKQVCVKSDPCEPACKCRFNHRRAKNGTCIPTKSCPPFSCKRVNEEYNPCPPICPTDDCSQATPTGKCTLIGRIGIVLPCDPKCRCINGYWKLNGTCVPYGECPGVCPANERYSGCIQGECRPLNCSDKGKSLPCPRIDPDFCETGCVCEEGYLRAKNGTCVLEDQCDANTCPPDEEYVSCIQGVCRAMDCSQKGKDVPCPDIPKEQCDSGCICKENFLRTDTGSCVPEDQCETHKCPANEEWSTCAQATCRAQNCTQKGKPIACPLIAEGYCIEACVCKTGYLRDDSGVCVPEDQCPSKLICGENEDLVNCSSTCTSDYCPRSANEKQVCVKSDPCKPACKCRFNHRRAKNGTCIPTRSCPAFSCKSRPNEEYNPCPPLCPSDACGQPRLKGVCPYSIKIILTCNPKCQCKDGYGRVNGTCIPFADCPDLCPTNEEYSPCVQATCRPQNCSQRDDERGPCPSYDAGSCQRGCVCKKNYYRNDKGVCVSYKQCGGPLCPNPNEVYSNNSKPCPPNTCISLVAKFKCAENQTEIPGCVCRSGYLRNENSTCVPICECPQMAGTLDCN